MSAALIAVSVGDTIVKFGAYAGYASIIGLGVLSLLYFAQAREVKRLREWAGRSPERDAELALRVQTDAQKRVVAQPLSPATTAAQNAEAARTAAAAALYAKVPAPPPPPAPLVGQPGQLARPVAPGALPGTAPATTAATTTPAPGSVPGATTPAPGSVPGATTPAPGSVPGATAITPGAAAAAAAGAAAASRSASVMGNGAGGQETHESDAARPDPADGPLPLDSFSSEDEGVFGFSPGRTGAIIGGAVAAVLVAVVLMIALTQGDDTPSKPNELGVVTSPASSPAPGGSSTTPTAAGPSAVDRRATRVAVLNGTTQTGLARTVADEVEKARFTISGTENNADQAVPTTTVSYSAGNQRAAQIVAQVLGIDRASVQPVDANSSVAADADVVVIVGADKIG
jgi:hypothetical protein